MLYETINCNPIQLTLFCIMMRKNNDHVNLCNESITCKVNTSEYTGVGQNNWNTNIFSTLFRSRFRI